ncbi:lysozyme inhibitor LprI family protein [Novosphingobium sp.]|uniref:lysozyme inhibitor LprI family protein n=1 Tax=Novosphingobium sp. TaxID=1874826 RepID=UPI0026321A75|nr:lysozyme inhibitor LprI family protein [Novosphingobium sp.]
MAHQIRILVLLAAAVPALTQAAPPFAYRMVQTPEEGPLDPKVEGRYTAAFTACQKTAQTTSDNADCFVAEFARQDAELNRTWQAVFPRIPAQQRPLLRAAQRRWVAARDPFCRRQSDSFSGGTIAPVIYVSCRTEQAIRRTLWLERLVKS